MPRTILHVDFNSYFATVEQQKNPFLRGRPVGVVKALGRGIIIAASVEAKQYGIKTGTTVGEAKRLVPQIALVPANFDSYYDVTRRFSRLCQRYSDQVELFSLDEVFLDVTDSAPLLGGAWEIARQLKREVRSELGEWITVSIGIAKNKLLAKLASDWEKPDGCVEITNHNQEWYLARADFEQICGIGIRLTRRLQAMGIRHLVQIRLLPAGMLAASFGPYWSAELRRMAWGRDESPIIPSHGLPLPKSVSRQHTLYQPVSDESRILATTRNLVEEVAQKLRFAKMAGRQFGLMIRGEHAFGLSSGEESRVEFVTRKGYTGDPGVIFREMLRLYRRINWRGTVRLVGVWVSLLAEETRLTPSLLPDELRRQRILAAQDRVNEKFGHYTIFPASLLRNAIVFPEVTGYLGDQCIRERTKTLQPGLDSSGY